MSAIVIMGIVILAQMGLIYGLVNRLIVQAGQRALTPQSDPRALMFGVPDQNAKVAHPRTPAGSLKVIS